MAEKILNIIMYVLAILLMVAVVVAVVYALVSTYQDKEIENEILAYFKRDTEDEGVYAILLQPCTEYHEENFPDAKWFFAWMMDDDGDYTMKVIAYYSPNDIQAQNVWWE